MKTDFTNWVGRKISLSKFFGKLLRPILFLALVAFETMSLQTLWFFRETYICFPRTS